MKPGHSPSTDELKDALIRSVEVAQAGLKEKPPVEPPSRLKQFMEFNKRKFPARALGQVREVLEADGEFRDRVVDAVAEGEMGPIGWLWLTRPDGWEQQCADLALAAEKESERAADAQRIQELTQRLQRSEALVKRADGQRDKAVRERDEARRQAAHAGAEARRADEKAAELAGELQVARSGLEGVRGELAQIQRKATRTEGKLKSALVQIDQQKKELRTSREQHGEEVSSLKERLAAAEDEVALAREAGFELPAEPEPEVPAPPTRRVRVPMPGGIHNDSTEAAEYLFRQVNDIVVLIDGYNVTFKNWDKLPVQEQRHRFLRNVEELSSRYSGAEFVVVFDGSETDYDYISTTARSLGVTVRFSRPGITADDHIIGQCDGYPLTRPIVVVSEDGDVRERARNRGANLVHPRKLLGIMGLEVEDPDGWSTFGEW